MATQGSIDYRIDIETSAVLKADKIVSTSINSQVNKFKELERELISVSQKISKTGVVTNAYGQVNVVATKKLADLRAEIDRVGNEAIDTANKQKRLKEQTEATARAFRIQSEAAQRARDRVIGFGSATRTASKNVGNFSRSSGQAGIQFQQFIGQVQGGQSPMLAFSQQSADLGFVLGFPLLGAITGIAASITGIFLPSLLNGETAVGRLQKVMESLRETAVTTDQGITLLSGGIEKLARVSKAAAAIQIELAIKKANAAINDARESIRDAAEEWAGFGQGTSLLNKQFGEAERASQRLGKTIKELTTGAAVEQEGLIAGLFGIDEATGLREAVASTAKEFNISKESALDYLRALSGFENGQVTFEEFAGTVLEVSKANKNSSDSFNEVAAATGKATASAAEAAEVLKVLESASKNLDKALEESSEGGFKKQEQAAKDLAAAVAAVTRAEERATAAKVRRDLAERARLEQSLTRTGLSPEQLLMNRQVAEIEILRLGFEQKLLTEQEFLMRSQELNRQHQEQLQGLQKDTTDKSSAAWKMFENQVIGSLASVVTGAQSGKEAISALSQTILTQAIGALIKMGIQAVVGQTTAAATGAATAAALSAAYATPAALVSLASFGANAAPAAAGIASTVALSNAISLSGAREHGGPVSAGSSYLVGERGPEIFTPTGGGGITSNKDSFGGGTTLNVTIENNTSSNVSTQLSDDGRQLKVFINEVANQINQNQGVIPQAMRNSTNTTFKAGR